MNFKNIGGSSETCASCFQFICTGLFMVSTCSYSFKCYQLVDLMCFQKSFTDVGHKSTQDTSDCWCRSFQRDKLRDSKNTWLVLLNMFFYVHPYLGK